MSLIKKTPVNKSTKQSTKQSTNSDINNLITDNIDVWTSAIKKRNAVGRGSSKKIELTGIKKLRELILELAVRGKLVPQNDNDEPASVLLEKIAEEKTQLIADKKIKKPKSLPMITDELKSFDLPNGWEWCHLQDVSSYIQRGKGPKYDDSGRVRVISQKCIQLSGFTVEPARSVSDESLEKYQEERFLQSRDLLWNSTGTGTVGRINLIDYIEEKSLVADSHVTVIRTMFLDAGFIKSFISAPGVQRRIQPGYNNSLVSGSTNQVELNTSSVISLEVPIPPLAEQHRIVTKVDELMALCDQLEQQTEESLSAHQTLVEVMLATLMPSTSKSAEGSCDSAVPVEESFQTSWQRIAEHFDLLFTTEQSIEQLKQTILQLAVMGKLVPQNPSDEPASVLLEKIAEEKAQLITDKVISKPKKLVEITDEDKAFRAPKGWAWVRLDPLFNVIVDCPHSTAKFQDSGHLCIDTNSFKQGQLHKHKFRFVSQETFDKRNARLIPRPKDIVFAREGSVGESVVIPNGIDCCLGQRVMLFRPSELLDAEFLRLTISNKGALNKLLSMHKGIGAKHVNVRDMRAFSVCLPPEKEQNRIIIKVDELMALCEQLKARLSDAQTTQLHLADAVVENAIN
ncbi:MAG: restriction endonuclease subunit S [Colwellia sp.]|nr:restriction endonuclease subunit S [Colwellia sp.]